MSAFYDSPLFNLLSPSKRLTPTLHSARTILVILFLKRIYFKPRKSTCASTIPISNLQSRQMNRARTSHTHMIAHFAHTVLLLILRIWCKPRWWVCLCSRWKYHCFSSISKITKLLFSLNFSFVFHIYESLQVCI